MAIYLAMHRVGVCEICGKDWIMAPLDEFSHCVYCGSPDWLWGIEPMESRFVRQGISRSRKAQNPGARSRKRQTQGKTQWRQFKPKPEEKK